MAFPNKKAPSKRGLWLFLRLLLEASAAAVGATAITATVVPTGLIGARLGFVDLHGAALEIGAVEGFLDTGGFLGGTHLHESETFAIDDVDFFDRAVLRE